MARPLLSVASAHSRQLLGYYSNGYYNNSCYNRAGCLAGSIIGAIIFALIALGLLICLLVRLKRQRAANAAYQQNQPGYVGNTAAPTYPGYTGNQQYPPQYPPQQQQPGAYNNQGQGGPQPPPPNMTDAQRQEWEAEQYAKYGEAGLVQGYPVNNGGAGPSGGVQMTQIPPHKQ